MSEDARILLVCEVKILMTLDHTAFQVLSCGYCRAELVGLSGKALIRDATRRLGFVVNAAS